MNTDFTVFLEEVERLKECRRFKEALSLVEGAISRYPERYDLYEELADIFIFLGEFDKAKVALDYAESLERGSSTGLYLRGYLALVTNNFLQAIVYLEESNIKSPNNPEVLRNLGWAYTMIGEYKKGVIILERALNISPEDELIIEDLGVALLTQGKLVEAKAQLKKIGKENHIDNMGFGI